MKKRYIILFFLLVTLIGDSFAQKTQFYIKSTVGGLHPKEIAGLPTYFATVFNDCLKEKYSCTTVLTESDVRSQLEWEKQRQLLGSGSDETLKSISEALGVDYLVSFEVSVIIGEKFIANGTLIPMRTKPVFPLVKASAYSDYSNKSFNKIDANLKEVAKKLVDGLKRIEICPFKGPVKVEMISKIDSSQTVEYPVYCNKNDGMFRKVSTIFKNTDNNWTIERTGLGSAKGNIKFTLSEVTSVEEKNDCYECSPQKQGLRTYSQKEIHRADVQKLSKESESNGIKVDDARVDLTFLDNGTYTVRIKASSKQGDMKIRTEEKAEGICSNINTKPDIKEKKADVGLYQIFGPFKGTAQDKVLSHKDTIKKKNPSSGEDETITYEFNLKRD